MENINYIQEASASDVDTLTEAYSGQWEGLAGAEESSAFVQMMASNDLIFVVLGVSLIIWFVLLFYMIKVDRDVTRLEEVLERSDSKRSEEQPKESPKAQAGTQ